MINYFIQYTYIPKNGYKTSPKNDVDVTTCSSLSTIPASSTPHENLNFDLTGTLSFDSFTSNINHYVAQEFVNVKAEDCVTPRNDEFSQKRSYETAFESFPTAATTFSSTPYTTTSYEEDEEQVGLDLDAEWTPRSATSSATITCVPSYKRPCTQCACGRMYTPSSSMTQKNIPEIQESSSTTTPMVWSTTPTGATAVPAVLRNSAGTPVPGIFYIFPTGYAPSHYTYAHMATAASTTASTAGVSSTEQASTMSGSYPPITPTTTTTTLSVLTEAEEWLYVLESLEYNASRTPTSFSGTNSTTSSISSTPTYYTQKQHQQAVYTTGTGTSSTDRMESHNALLRREISYTSLYM